MDEALPGQQLPWIVKEELQQFCLLGGEPPFPPPNPHLALGQIELDRPGLDGVALISRQQPVNPIDQLARREGQNQVDGGSVARIRFGPFR